MTSNVLGESLVSEDAERASQFLLVAQLDANRRHDRWRPDRQAALAIGLSRQNTLSSPHTLIIRRIAGGVNPGDRRRRPVATSGSEGGRIEIRLAHRSRRRR
jgi:hypothetical protein